jgi:hypothetical protein
LEYWVAQVYASYAGRENTTPVLHPVMENGIEIGTGFGDGWTL